MRHIYHQWDYILMNLVEYFHTTLHIVNYIYILNLRIIQRIIYKFIGPYIAYITLIPSNPLKSFKSRQLTNWNIFPVAPSLTRPTNHLFCVCVCVDSLDSRVEFIAQDGAPFSGFVFANMFVQQLFLGAHDARQRWRLNVEARNSAGSTDQSLCRSGGPDESLTWWVWVLQRSPDANFGKLLGEVFAQGDLGSLLVSGLLDS